MANRVDIKINAEDDASGVFKNVQRNFALGAAAIGAAAVGVGVASVKMAAGFDKGMREVNTLLKLPEAQFKKLQDETLELSRQLGITADEVVPALYQAISAGVPRENVMEFLQTAGEASIGGVTDLTTAVDGLTSVVNAYGADAIDASRASDIMFTAVRLGKTTMGELSGALFNVIPSAVRVGIQFEEIAAAMATMTTQGVPTAVATTQLRSAIDSLSAPTIRQQKLMDELGLSFGGGRLASIGLSQAFAEVIEAARGDDSVLRKLLGSVEALSAVTILGGSGAQNFAAALREMDSSAGATTGAFDEMEKSTSRLWDHLKTDLNVVMVELGTEILPMVNEALLAFSKWSDDNLDKIVAGFDAWAAAVAEVGSALGGINASLPGGGLGRFMDAFVSVMPGGGLINLFRRRVEERLQAERRVEQAEAAAETERRRSPFHGLEQFIPQKEIRETVLAGDEFIDMMNNVEIVWRRQARVSEGMASAAEEETRAKEAAAEATRRAAEFEQRLADARQRIAEEQTAEIVEAFLQGGEDAVEAVRSEQAALDEQWTQIAAGMHETLGVAVPNEFRSMWEQMIDIEKRAKADLLREAERAAEKRLELERRVAAGFGSVAERVAVITGQTPEETQRGLIFGEQLHAALQRAQAGALVNLQPFIGVEGGVDPAALSALLGATGLRRVLDPDLGKFIITVQIGERELTDVVVEAGAAAEREGRSD